MFKKKLMGKIGVTTLSVTMLAGGVLPSIASAYTEDDISKNISSYGMQENLYENISEELLNNQDIATEDTNINTSSLYTLNQYAEQESIAEEAFEKIQQKYGRTRATVNSSGAIVMTAEDEVRVEKAITEYLEMVGYNPRLRGVGKNFWNSKSFATKVIDVAIIAMGLSGSYASAAAVRKIIRANRTNITRVIEKDILKKIGLGGANFASAAIDTALIITGTSIGAVVSEGLDRADKKNDDYIFA